MKSFSSFLWALGTVLASALVAWLIAREAPHEDYSHGPGPGCLHDWLHKNLAITPEQEALLMPIELAFEVDAEHCRAEIEAAGAALARAIRESSQASTEISDARRHLQEAKSRLEEVTLEHFFAMKKHLTPEQGEKLLEWTHDSILHGHHR